MRQIMTLCSGCGTLHPVGTRSCGTYGPKRETVANRFRKTNKWRIKSEQIRERDKYLCRVCLSGRYGGGWLYNYTNLSVHHIVPLAEDVESGLDEDNLITVCDYHHRIAEEGRIPRSELTEIITIPPGP